MDKTEWIEREVENSTSEDGEYYPFNHDNILEALANLDDGTNLFLTTQIAVASKLPDNPMSQDCCVYSVLKVIRDYWETCARKHAEVIFDRFQPIEFEERGMA